ncbi:MAG: nitroreductase family deazaflavin-dependent oxidoreductase [Mycobacterium sp.]|nr:nitroreductase family deazaflavin-dependent oxidoreductase [Mycobacterium sp.]
MAENPFPEPPRRAGPGLVRRVGETFAATPVGSRFMRALVPLDRRLLSRTGGRLSVLGPAGLQMLLLTTIGRKSGQRRQSPLVYTRDAERIFLFGSNFGQAGHPAWSSNLMADPNCWVTLAGKEIPVVATLLAGDEYERVQRMFMEYVKVYPAYRTRTDRRVRIFALTPR